MRKKTLLLSEKWDIYLDSNGNIATIGGLYADAQNVANAVRLFTNDAFFNRQKGVPHFTLDLAVMPTVSEVCHEYRKAALAVENIAEAVIDLTGVDESRALIGKITATTEQGEQFTAEF